MSRPLRALLIAVAVFLSGCATPVAPSGGPRDETPPELEATVPARRAVNVDAEFVRFTFSEYVDQGSFEQAFSISPSFSRPVDFNWSGRTVVVRFPEPTSENTTYVITIDTNLRDAHSVALASPIVYAFSTGPTINAGTLGGRVVAPADGEPISGVDVLAFARPDSTAPGALAAAPGYRTQTGTDGSFRFEYLTEQHYFVPALQDANRNLLPDRQEAFAVPPAPAFFADSTTSEIQIPWVLAEIDTTRPAALRAESPTRSRHLVRFSEPVLFLDRDPEAWTLTDSSTGQREDIHMLYMLQSEPREVHVVTEDLQARRFRIVPAALSDTSGNRVASEPLFFTPGERDDTLGLRFIEFLPAEAAAGDVTTLPHEVDPGIRFNRTIDGDLLSTVVSVIDTTGAERSFVAITSNGTDVYLSADPPVQPGEWVTIDVDASQLSGADTTYSRSFRRISEDETGEIAGIARAVRGTSDVPLSPDDIDARIVVEAYPVDIEIDASVPTYRTSADSTGAFLLSGLPAGSYRMRAFADMDGSGTWDPGRLVPYHPAEAIAWHAEPLRVRSRWETALPDTLRLPLP